VALQKKISMKLTSFDGDSVGCTFAVDTKLSTVSTVSTVESNISSFCFTPLLVNVIVSTSDVSASHTDTVSVTFDDMTYEDELLSIAVVSNEDDDV